MKQIYPSTFMLRADETVKSTSLHYDHLELIGCDITGYLDFEQPILKSYVVSDISDSATLFMAGYDVSLAMFSQIQRMSVMIVDQSTGNPVLCPTDDIQIYMNIVDATEMDNTNAPFSYLLTSAFEFGYVKNWLFSLRIKNSTGALLKAFIQLSKYKEGDQNFDPNFYR